MFNFFKNLFVFCVILKHYIIQLFVDIIIKNERHTFSFQISEVSIDTYCVIISRLLNCDPESVNSYYSEFMSNDLLRHDYKARFGKSLNESGGRVLLYIIIRLLKPKVLVENGHYKGQNSLIITYAMNANFDIDKIASTLYSIDINRNGLVSFQKNHLIVNSTIENFFNNYSNLNIGFYFSDGERTPESEEMELYYLDKMLDINGIIVSNKLLFSNVFLKYFFDKGYKFETFMETTTKTTFRGNYYSFCLKSKI